MDNTSNEYLRASWKLEISGYPLKQSFCNKETPCKIWYKNCTQTACNIQETEHPIINLMMRFYPLFIVSVANTSNLVALIDSRARTRQQYLRNFRFTDICELIEIIQHELIKSVYPWFHRATRLIRFSFQLVLRLISLNSFRLYFPRFLKYYLDTLQRRKVLTRPLHAA